MLNHIDQKKTHSESALYNKQLNKSWRAPKIVALNLPFTQGSQPAATESTEGPLSS